MALRRGRDLGGWLLAVPGRARRHPGSEGSQAQSQDRPHRRAAAERAAARGRPPESWIPPEAVLEWRERVRLYKSLVDQRTLWCQRIHAVLYHHGVTVPEGAIRSDKTRAMLASDEVELSSAARERIDAAYKMVDAADAEAQPLKHALQRFGTRQPACRALVDAQYGIGGLLAVVLWTELGDCRRFSRSEQAVRHSGLDVTVDASDRRRAGGHLSRQGPEALRWALYEAAKNSSHGRSPDHRYYAKVKERHDGKIAAISVARQLARRSYHVLRAVEPDLVYAIPA